MDSLTKITVRGARVHNLKNVDLAFPKRKLVVFTGVSGSGKSSMAFDTLFAEGQRRYVESLSVYARQFRTPRAPRRRRAHRALTHDLHRAEVDLAQPALHGRHDHRDPRPPPVLWAQLGKQHCHPAVRRWRA